MVRKKEKRGSLQRVLGASILVNLLFSVAQFILGALFGSLALISSGGHGLTDALSMAISYAATRVSSRHADAGNTYGYGRASIFAALINGILLVVFAIFILYEAYVRIWNPVPVQGYAVIVTALVGILISGVISLALRRHRSDLNARGAFLHALYDMAALFGTLLAGILVVVTGRPIFDPVISVLVSVLIIVSVWGIIDEASHILFEGVPRGIDIESVRKAIKSVRGVSGAHDLHIWAISSRYVAMSCHIVVRTNSLANCSRVVAGVKLMLAKRFSISHATIEVESEHLRAVHTHWDTKGG